MLYEIEKAFKTTLEAAGLGFKAVEEKGENPVDSTPTPAALPLVGDGDFERLSEGKWKCTVEIGVLLLVKDVSGEPGRRRAILPLIEGVIRLFVGKTLGLDIKKIRPKGFVNTTSEAFRKKNLAAFIIGFETDFSLLETDVEADALDLLRIGLNYFLQDPADDAVADASDIVGAAPIYPGTFSAITFTGAGLDDLTLGGTLGGGAAVDFGLKISAVGAEYDTLEISYDDGTTWAAFGAIYPAGTGGQTLVFFRPDLFPEGSDLTFEFAEQTGHTLGDTWLFTFTPEIS